ncbi:hypothetical protein GPL15_18600 [Clostridium sp. MCC353]|uniref:hypothetical protein n=1 Tax=Clostridium sp. MCC353 TaxID=2592646 RepID=UPI001C0190B6|nr:hypothetical protein [Clostridium sp. MCC353]MBT9778513.1 hypothetical protein [Clostridium sp. MCC353]
MFKVTIEPLLETSDNLKVLSLRMEQEAETLKSVDAALRSLSYLDEQRRDIRKKLADLEEKQMQMSQMAQALSQIAECYKKSEERIETEYEQPKGMITAAEFDVSRFKNLFASLKRMEVI